MEGCIGLRVFKDVNLMGWSSKITSQTYFSNQLQYKEKK